MNAFMAMKSNAAEKGESWIQVNFAFLQHPKRCSY